MAERDGGWARGRLNCVGRHGPLGWHDLLCLGRPLARPFGPGEEKGSESCFGLAWFYWAEG